MKPTICVCPGRPVSPRLGGAFASSRGQSIFAMPLAAMPLAAMAFAAMAFAAMAFAVSPSRASAQVGLRLQEVPAKTVRVDGRLREWGGVEEASLGAGPDASMRYRLGYDAKGLYIAATVYDDRLIRSAAPGTQEDAVIVTLVLPGPGRSLNAQEIYLWAGVPGRMASKLGLASFGKAPKPLQGGTIVEGPLPRGRGYVFEAFVPWSALAGGKDWQKGRGAIRLRDVDTEAGRAIEAEPTSAPIDPKQLASLPDLVPSGGSQGLLASFASANNLPSARPRFDFRADVSGDQREERIAVIDRFVVVLGEGYKDGQSYDFAALPIRHEAALLSASMRDLTGDGKAELLVTLRQRGDRGSRDLWQVYRFSAGVKAVFTIELRKETPAGSVASSMAIASPRKKKKGPPVITIKAGKPKGLTPEVFHEAPASDADAILLPWGPVLERSFQWDGEGFAKVGERANPKPWQPAPAATASRSGSGGRRAATRETRRAAPGEDELLSAARDAARISPRVKERFRRTVNVAEGSESELLVVLDKALVVVGRGFRGGEGYFHYELPVASGADVTALHTEDVTGDGRAEIFVQLKQRVGDVEREILIAHQFTPRGFPRLMAAEIARRADRSSIENEVRFVGKGRSRALVLRPGRAQGWSRATYPYRDEPSGDGIEAPLLPWSSREMRYRFVRDRLVR